MKNLEEWCKENNKLNLLDEWHPVKNGVLTPADYSYGSHKKVWWICPLGHEYETEIKSRSGGCGCSICSNRYVLEGYNDLETFSPMIAKEWHPAKNGELSPTKVLYGSHKKVWWKCAECGYEWQAVICSRTCNGRGCPLCGQKKSNELGVQSRLEKNGSLADNYPNIVKEWHPTKNTKLSPANITCGSHKIVWWQCSEGHEWKAGVKDRVCQKQGCPFCAGKRALYGYNDLATMTPELIMEWHPTKNGSLKPSDVTGGSSKKVWWLCANGHEWQATISNRNKGDSSTGCPICANKQILNGFNDLATVYPGLAKEWHPTKNDPLKPTDVTRGSGKKVWWICQYGHEWKAGIGDRVRGSGCPQCSGQGTSIPEQGIAFYIEKVCKIEQRVKISGKEIDVFLPEFQIGIEYDGRYFHTQENRKKEIEKDTQVSKAGVKLIRIKESDKNAVHGRVVYFDTDYLGDNYEWALNQLLSMLVSLTNNQVFGQISIDVKRDLLQIREKSNLFNKKKSLSALYPDIAKEWHPIKNGALLPAMFSAGANTKVWWQCAKGHAWEAIINNRTGHGDGCPYCLNMRVLKGFNDLATVCPDIAKEWHPTKNGKLKVTDVSGGSVKKVWWECSKGHEWEAHVNTRVSKGYGCPICSNKKVLIGYNDLETIHSELAKEWHPVKNGPVKPTDVTSGSGKRVWWLCAEGHEWQATVSDRASKHIGCPICSNFQALKGFNDLATVRPEIAKEWHPIKNGELKPTDVVCGSDKKVWWQCYKGHEWTAHVKSRTGRNEGCPICANKRVLRGFNDLETTHPMVAQEWHPIKNADLTPADVTSGSGKRVWWLCAEGHEWQAAVAGRTSRGEGCPLCGRKKSADSRIRTIRLNKGSLADNYPEIAKEWHPQKNGNKYAADVNWGSSQKVWWQCSRGHEWKAAITNRVGQRQGCPICSNKRVLKGFNDLATVRPEIAKEWHSIKNGDLKPTDVVCGSHRKVWWKCEKCGKEWQATVNSRTSNGYGCKVCSKKKAVRLKVKNLIMKEGSLSDHYPEIAKEWHLEKNDDLRPTDVTSSSNKKVWWQCSRGHEWKACICDRTGQRQGCPVCSNRIVLKGFNDLETNNPEIAKEWHNTKNGELKPCDVTKGCNKKVWWKCSNCSWEWEAIINNRTKGSGCPRCARAQRKRG